MRTLSLIVLLQLIVFFAVVRAYTGITVFRKSTNLGKTWPSQYQYAALSNLFNGPKVKIAPLDWAIPKSQIKWLAFQHGYMYDSIRVERDAPPQMYFEQVTPDPTTTRRYWTEGR